MNLAAILALIADLYSQVTTLTEENRKLRDTLASLEVRVDSSPSGTSTTAQ